MERTGQQSEPTREAVRRMLRMAEVTRLMGDMRGAAALTVKAEQLWLGARDNKASKSARKHQDVLAA